MAFGKNIIFIFTILDLQSTDGSYSNVNNTKKICNTNYKSTFYKIDILHFFKKIIY